MYNESFSQSLNVFDTLFDVYKELSRQNSSLHTGSIIFITEHEATYIIDNNLKLILIDTKKIFNNIKAGSKFSIVNDEKYLDTDVFIKLQKVIMLNALYDNFAVCIESKNKDNIGKIFEIDYKATVNEL